MNPSPKAGQDTSVAVLQVQIQNQQQTMLDLARTVNEGLNNLSAKVDRLSEVATTIAAISERMANHSDGLQRAFQEARALDKRLTEHLEESGQWREALIRNFDQKLEVQMVQLHEAKGTISTWRGIVVGFMTAISIAGGMLTFLAGKYITETERNSESIHNLETQVKSLPYAVEKQR